MGECIAIRVPDAVLSLKKSHGDAIDYSAGDIENAILAQKIGKKCKQIFLNATSCDGSINKSQKGFGGNTTSQICVIIAESEIDPDLLLVN